MIFDFKDSHGAVVCSVRMEHLWADVYGLVQKAEQKNINAETWLGLFSKAIEAAKAKGARYINFRLIENEKSEELADRLPELGFFKKQDRIEFRRKLSDLPTGADSPIQWKTAQELGFAESDVANFLALVAEGDPDTEPTDDPLTYIQDWMKDPVLTCGTNCIGIGSVSGEPCAFVVAQINPKSKWSRISYMGLAPKFRSQRLGVWVHRHGFDMMRAQGGELYHGGTSADNLPMLRLFEHHGCEVHCKMQEWILSFESGGSR